MISRTKPQNLFSRIWPAVVLIFVIVAALPFAHHSFYKGFGGIQGDASILENLYSVLHPVATFAISHHMIAGAAITVLAPLQLIPAIRRRFPAFHRWTGRFTLILAVTTALAGLVFIASRGTVGGMHMSIAFSVYGMLMLLAAIQTFRYAARRDFKLHQMWALRLFVLAIGSWLYRVHYGLWHVFTDGIGTNDQFTGLFDQIQLWAFFVPQLVLLEIILGARQSNRGQAVIRRA